MGTIQQQPKNIMSSPQDKSQAAPEEKRSDEHINLRVVSQDGAEVFFKIKKTTPLRKLMDAFCSRNSIDPGSVRFLFDGQRLSPDKTPKECAMEDHDVIDVLLQQTGGF